MTKRILRIVPSQDQKRSKSQTIKIFEHEGKLVCSSRQVAEKFDRPHFQVLRDVKNSDCPKSFNNSHFKVITYVDSRGRTQEEVLITKDGLMFLVMGYKGPLASRIKIKFLEAFNEMSEVLIPKLQQRIAELEAGTQTPRLPAKPKVPSFVQFCKDMEIPIAEQEENFRYTVARYIRYIIKNFPDENIYEVIKRKIRSAIYGADNHPAYSLADKIVDEVIDTLEQEELVI